MDTHVTSVTTSSLLQALAESRNEAAWQEMDARYRPIIVRLAGRAGLSEEDAADVAQEVLLHAVRDYRAGKYDAGRGRLRAWMAGIARHRICDALRKRVLRQPVRGTSAIQSLEEPEFSRSWDAEAARVLLERAVLELQASSRIGQRTLQAFRLHVIEELPADAVAERLRISARAVYLAKHRCLRRLRSIVDALRCVENE